MNMEMGSSLLDCHCFWTVGWDNPTSCRCQNSLHRNFHGWELVLYTRLDMWRIRISSLFLFFSVLFKFILQTLDIFSLVGFLWEIWNKCDIRVTGFDEGWCLIDLSCELLVGLYRDEGESGEWFKEMMGAIA